MNSGSQSKMQSRPMTLAQEGQRCFHDEGPVPPQCQRLSHPASPSGWRVGVLPWGAIRDMHKVSRCVQVIMLSKIVPLMSSIWYNVVTSSSWFCCHEVTHLCNYSKHVWIASAFSNFARRHTTHSHLTHTRRGKVLGLWVGGDGG